MGCRYVVAGRQAGEPLQESPYLMHPVECNTVGLYKTPVAILDFASLYPSLYRAHNLCYTTLLHPDDVAGLPPEQTTPVLRPKANVKSHFVKPELRRGILPSILAALIEARATTRAALKEASDPGMFAIWFCFPVLHVSQLGPDPPARQVHLQLSVRGLWTHSVGRHMLIYA